MEYRNAEYTADGSIKVEINHPKLGWVPFTASPSDPKKYGRDLFTEIAASGNVAIYVEPASPTYTELLDEEREGMVVSRFQAKAALSEAGLLEAAETAVAGADTITKLAWAEAIEFRRNSPTIKTLADTLNLSPTQLDNLFRAASQIEA